MVHHDARQRRTRSGARSAPSSRQGAPQAREAVRSSAHASLSATWTRTSAEAYAASKAARSPSPRNIGGGPGPSGVRINAVLRARWTRGEPRRDAHGRPGDLRSLASEAGVMRSCSRTRSGHPTGMSSRCYGRRKGATMVQRSGPRAHRRYARRGLFSRGRKKSGEGDENQQPRRAAADMRARWTAPSRRCAWSSFAVSFAAPACGFPPPKGDEVNALFSIRLAKLRSGADELLSGR